MVVLRQFRLIFAAVKSHMGSLESTTQIGGILVWALSEIHSRPGIKVNDLAHAMDVSQPSASGYVSALLRNGLITAHELPEDRRIRQLVLTEKGEKVLMSAPGPYKGLLPAALGRLDQEHLGRLHTDLEVLLTEMGIPDNAESTPIMVTFKEEKAAAKGKKAPG